MVSSIIRIAFDFMAPLASLFLDLNVSLQAFQARRFNEPMGTIVTRAIGLM
jgi:hypothetical protein